MLQLRCAWASGRWEEEFSQAAKQPPDGKAHPIEITTAARAATPPVDIMQASLYIHDIMAKQLTIRNLSPDLARRLKTLAREESTSVNSLVLTLLETAVGFNRRREWLSGWATWTEQDAQEFDVILQEQRTIDEEMWR